LNNNDIKKVINSLLKKWSVGRKIGFADGMKISLCSIFELWLCSATVFFGINVNAVALNYTCLCCWHLGGRGGMVWPIPDIESVIGSWQHKPE
jgi:hypothetical protein